MSIYLPFREDNFLEYVDEVIKKWGQCTAPLFIEQVSKSGKITGAADLIGSSFFAARRGHYFLVSAAHVFDDQNPLRKFGVNVNGKGALLNGIPIVRCKIDDIAVALLPEAWFSYAKIERLKAVPLDDSVTHYSPIGIWVAIGYPASKNGLNPRLNKTQIVTHGTSFTDRIERPSAKSHISNPVGFRFDKKRVINTKMEPANPPCFSGTSGGPVFEVLAAVDNHGSFRWKCHLEGVFLGWHNREKEAHAARVQPLKNLMDQIIDHVNK
ncbi:serine protease family protein [Pseudomonas bananamidigenes]|uniref:serine protease n=1 Tax=Pseudomonas bananamidigenes TaxID=2843610 RepID=UPI00080395FE|nr:serine protease [Pseudomonas bananamidigenes]